MNNDNYDLKSSAVLVLEVLFKRFGEKQIKGLLTGDSIITNKPTVAREDFYSRHLQETKNLFCECKDGKHEWCTSPGSLIQALEDAREVMNYSNWFGDKADRAIELIFRHCEENKIPLWHDREPEPINPKGE